MAIAADHVRRQMERLLRSDLFSAPTSHHRLLEYLAEKSLLGQADHLKEYTIGVEVFGKPESYDPREDSIVRHQAARLRQKLIEYYQGEGAGDPVVLVLPKGHFRIDFEQRARGEAQLVRIWQVVSGVLALLLLAAAVLLFRGPRPQVSEGAAPAWPAALETLWEPFLKSNRPMVVCVGTPLFVRFPSGGYFRDHRINDWETAKASPKIATLRKDLGALPPTPWHNFTGIGEAHAVFGLSRLLGPRRADLSLARSHLLSWDQIASHDVVFVGPPKFNLQLREMPIEPAFAIEGSGVRNLNPRQGEPSVFETGSSNDNMEGESYALISMTPGLNGKGTILVLAGNAGPDTQAAAEWVTDPLHASELVSKLRLPDGKMPGAFQVVVKVRYKNLIPVHTAYVTHRALQKRPATTPEP